MLKAIMVFLGLDDPLLITRRGKGQLSGGNPYPLSDALKITGVRPENAPAGNPGARAFIDDTFWSILCSAWKPTSFVAAHGSLHQGCLTWQSFNMQRKEDEGGLGRAQVMMARKPRASEDLPAMWSAGHHTRCGLRLPLPAARMRYPPPPGCRTLHWAKHTLPL
jgi:hypothetical protein